MNPIAFFLVIISAFTHVYWNYLLKRTNGGISFVWVFTFITVIIYTPLFMLNPFNIKITFSWPLIIVFAISIICHLLYFIFLDKAYRYGDLSIIYPVARGIAPVFTIIFAIVILREKLTNIQYVSVILVLLGTYFLSELRFKSNDRKIKSLAYAILCGLMVAAYTIVDKAAVGIYLISPFLLDFTNNIGRLLLLTPIVFNDKKNCLELIRSKYKEAIVIALLSPFSYLLVLFAMRFAPVSLISPLRQVSVVLSALFGMFLLSEAKSYLKFIGIIMTSLGLVTINM